MATNIHSTLKSAEKFFEKSEYGSCLKLLNIIIKSFPNHSRTNELLGYIAGNSGDIDSAIQYLKISTANTDCSPESIYYLGTLYLQKKLYLPAIICFKNSLSIAGNFFEGLHDLGTALALSGEKENALSAYVAALKLKNNSPELLFNLARLYEDILKYDLARSYYLQLKKLNPKYPYILGDVYHIDIISGNLVDAVSIKKEMMMSSISGHKVATPLTLLSIFDSPELQQKAAQSFVLDKCPPSNAIPTKPNRRHDRIRIAYFSSDFRSHAVSFLTAELFELHDRNRFDVYAFSLRRVSPEDKMSQRLLSSFDHFYELEDQSPLDIAQLARSLEIDIAIDLNGHTQGAMSGIFADRAAPIQINYLGYPGTMGASYMDYIIADQHLIPQENRHFYTEKIIYLPHSFQVNDSKRKIGSAKLTRQDHLLPSSGFIFCCFNNAHKVNLDIFTAWMQILKGVPESYLWLLSIAPTTEENLRNQAQCLGVEPARLIFGGRLAPDEYLARFQMADLFLDTLPFNGGTTISDALWVGLPVLTQAGHSFAGRMGASLLNAVHLPQLITNSREDYIQMAIELGNDTDRLLEIKQTLAKELKKCPLFNSAQFTKNIESAFLTVYETYQNQEELSHVFVG